MAFCIVSEAASKSHERGFSLSYSKYFETDILPREGDTITLDEEGKPTLEFSVMGTAWHLKNGRLEPTVHLSGGGSAEDFEAWGWWE